MREGGGQEMRRAEKDEKVNKNENRMRGEGQRKEKVSLSLGHVQYVSGLKNTMHTDCQPLQAYLSELFQTHSNLSKMQSFS